MAQPDDNPKVSAEAEARKTIDGLTAKLAEAEAALADVAISNRARNHFAGKGMSAADVEWAVDMALPHLRSVELEQVGETLDSDRFKPMWDRTPPTEPAETPPVETGSQFSTPQPAPAADGTKPDLPKFTVKSPEYQQALATNNVALLQQWDDEGRIDWHPNNPYRPEASTPAG